MYNKKEILSSEMQEEVKNKRNETNISRRSFLKKSAYSAPALMVMGQLAKPTLAEADYTPDGTPGQWNPNP